MKRILFLIVAIYVMVSASFASDFKITPTGRALFDVAAYAPSDSLFRPGVTIPDVRLGAKANFDDFEARADVSYRFGKLYLADVYLQWNINERSFLKGGFFVHQFGLQSATGASHKISMEEPIAQTVFGEIRLLGAMYVWHNSKIHFAGSLFAQPEASVLHANEMGNTGVGAAARFVWHPFTSTGNIFQIGTSALIQTPDYSGNRHNPVSQFTSTFPTRVNNVNMLKATVDSVSSIFKITPELLWAKGRWGVEAQFYWLNTSRRHNLPAFRGYGAYVMGRVLLNRGAQYAYSAAPAALATPKPKSWEIVVGYSFANLNDHHSHINGSHGNDASLTLNYYLNKYITWRFNYTYANRYEAPGLPSLHANIFQTRIQFVF